MDQLSINHCCKYLVATLTILLAACDSGPVEQTRELAVRPIKLVTIEDANTQESLSFPAVISASQSSELAFQVGGLLQELSVIEAQDIEENAAIAKLDQRDYQSKLASAQAQFDNADTEYQRALRLVKEDAIAQSVVEQRKSQHDVAEAQLTSAKKALEDTVLRAPFSGVVAKVHAKRLQTIQPGESIIVLLGDESLEATINLPASIIAQVPARPESERDAIVILDGFPNNLIPAEFKEAALEADAVSQTYEVSFAFQPPENLLILPGMNATVILSSSAITADAVNNQVVVPLAAIMTDGEQQYVWVVNAGETMSVSKRDVTVKDGIGKTVVITEGLTVGETIAGAGAPYLAEGMKVRPWTD
ncbi:MAG: efflux RND transporter periplasmic adaptor subunit [Pseudomonadota bacterium]